jgi:hypothetical protein
MLLPNKITKANRPGATHLKIHDCAQRFCILYVHCYTKGYEHGLLKIEAVNTYECHKGIHSNGGQTDQNAELTSAFRVTLLLVIDP